MYGSIVAWSIGTALVTMLISVGVTLAVVFLIVKPEYNSKTSDINNRLKTTIYDVNVQNAASKEFDDEQLWYMKNVLLARIQNIEAKVNATPTRIS